jgi:DNA polymerase-3 subunit epsilon
MHDKIIQFCAVPFTYGLNGVLYEYGGHYVGFNDPGAPLSEEIVKLTGLTDADVSGQKLDEDVILSVAADSDIIVAHNADYDRKMIERHFGASPFQDRPWACSQEDVPWQELLGVRNKKLDYLLMVAANAFHAVHGATADCYGALHLLGVTSPRPPHTYFAHLLRSARTPKSRVWAIGAPFETKDVLKRRSYRWNDGADGRHKAWWKDIADDRLDEEREWLRTEARCHRPLAITVTAYDRYSVRA